MSGDSDSLQRKYPVPSQQSLRFHTAFPSAVSEQGHEPAQEGLNASTLSLPPFPGKWLSLLNAEDALHCGDRRTSKVVAHNEGAGELFFNVQRRPAPPWG